VLLPGAGGVPVPTLGVPASVVVVVVAAAAAVVAAAA